MDRQSDLFSSREFEDHESWLSWLNDELPKPISSDDAPLVFDLFAGCGGMALGFEAQGFRTSGFEMKSEAVDTYLSNLDGECHEVFLEIGMPEGEVDVIVGGPPCQPFSQIGYQRGKRDKRDGFPIFLDAVKRLRPKIAIIENVRGLLFRNKTYLRQTAKELERFGYTVDARLMNTVHYGVPQKRERVVIVGSLVGWEWPDRVVASPVTTGIALGPMAREFGPHNRFLTPSMDRYIAEYERKSHCVNPRDLNLEKPSRTVTCRNLGGATSDMLRLRLSDGRRRMLTVREGARLQSFPDWFEFSGGQYERFEQIGNAVPPLLGLAIAKQVRKVLNRDHPQPTGRIKSGQRIHTMNADLLDVNPATEKIEQTTNILRNIGVPVREMTNRRKERVALALLAVAYLKPEDPWSTAQSVFCDGPKPSTTREIIRFWNAHYGQDIADSSYDDVRRKDLIILVEAGLVARSAADPAADVNDGTRGYAVTEGSLPLIRSYGTDGWENELIKFRRNVGALSDRLSKAREFHLVPVTLPDGQSFKLSPGPHNKIQKAVIEEFLPRFSNGAEVLYLGDTEKKFLHMDPDRMNELGLQELSREMLPDILAYESERQWIFLIEAVHSSNPISQMRHLALRRLTRGAKVGCVYVSAFENMKAFASFSKEISWETEVWVADNPDHMIHFNGDKFLGPYEG
jgi:site-specific DNA-cytosine methylase